MTDIRVDIYGEIHTTADRNRVEWAIIDNHRKKPYDFLLCEELGPHEHHTAKAQDKALKEKMYSIGPMGLELAKKLGIPAIGIDDWSDATYAKDIKDKKGMAVNFSRSFYIRETKMVAKIKKYMAKGRCAVMLGDSHLRTTKTKELGDASLIWETFKDNPEVKFHRSPKREID